MGDRHNGDAGDGSAPAPAKKPYAEPVLQEWGSFEDLTLSVGNQGKRDGGNQSHRKSTRA